MRPSALRRGSEPCDCGTAACSGLVVGSFFALPAERQQAYLRYAPDFIKKEYCRRRGLPPRARRTRDVGRTVRAAALNLHHAWMTVFVTAVS